MKENSKSIWAEIKQLIKFRIALLSTMTAVTGYIVALRGFSWMLLPFILGLFLLAGGSAALNQYQERHLDGLMERTRNRPLPSGRLSAGMGLVIAIGFMGAGLAILYFIYGLLPALLGFATAVLYNGAYTYLKRVTAFAAVPGALIGALPPAIGWFAAGGPIQSPMLLALVFFFYIWQIPHFWLLLGIHSVDYSKAGFPTMTDLFSSSQLSRITYTWVVATACAGLLFPLFGVFRNAISLAVLTAIVVWLAWRSIPLAKKHLSANVVFRKIFMQINIFAMVIMIILILEHGLGA